MLDALRQSAGGPFAKVLIGLLVASFAVWGISGSILGGIGYNVIQVGTTNVGVMDYQLAYNGQLNRLSREFQRRLTRVEANQFGLEQMVIAQLVSGAVLDENASKMGLGLSNDQLAGLIGDDPNFVDASGQFSRAQLQLVLRQIGMSEADYVENQKQIAVRNQILDGAAGAFAMPKTFTNALEAYQQEERIFEYVVIGEEVVADIPSPTEEDISTYYETNKPAYVPPQYRKLEIIKLEAEDIAKPEEITEDELQQAYEDSLARYSTSEKRRVQQLVLENKEQADQVYGKLNSGAGFEDIVSELGKSLTDVDIGLVEKTGIPDQNIADSAFALELNKPSDVVDGIFGPVILRVTEIQEEEVKPLFEVENELRNDLALEKAADEVFDLHDTIEDELAAGAGLSEAASKAALKTTVFDAVDRGGRRPDGTEVTGIPALEELLRQAFDTGIDIETAPILLGSRGYIWFRVVDIIDERQKPLEEVREDVRSAWIATETQKSIRETADKIVDRIRGGRNFSDVLAEMLPPDSLGNSVTSKMSGPIRRNTPQPDLGSQVLEAGFTSVDGSIHVAPAAEAGKFTIFKVSKRKAEGADDLDDALIAQLNEAAADDLFTQLVTDFQIREDIRINRQLIEQINTYN